MNVSYDRRALEAIDDLLRAGQWECWLHPRLLERGFELWCEPEAVLEHAKDFGFVEFVSQRYHYSRSYAGMRNAELGRKRVPLRARLAAARRRCCTRASRGTCSRGAATGASSRSRRR